MQWFKFFGSEYLADPKMRLLTAAERSCWVTLMCYASLSKGTVNHLDEAALMEEAGINVHRKEWDVTRGVLQKFIKLNMVKLSSDGTVKLTNWHKRQESYTTSTERMRRMRAKGQSDGGPRHSVTETRHKSDARLEENRIEKKRREKSGDKMPLLAQDAEEIRKRKEEIGRRMHYNK